MPESTDTTQAGVANQKTATARSAPESLEFTKAKLNELLQTGRPHRQYSIWDTKQTGLSVLVSRGPKGKRQATVTFRVTYYLKDNPGKPRYKALGRYPDEQSDLEAIRLEASEIRNAAKRGIDPKKPKLTGKFGETVDRFIEDHAKENRTWPEAKRIFERYVKPEWADLNIEEITKNHVTDLLTKIRRGKIEHNGKHYGTKAVARATRGQLVTLFNWYEAKHTTGKDFRNPIPKLMKNDPLKAPQERERSLEDLEIRALWTACSEMGAYGAAVRTALLAMQRFRKAGQMRRSDLKDHIRIQSHMKDGRWIEDQDINNVWDPTRDDDPKNKRVSVVPLPPLARKIIDEVPIIDVTNGKDFVFTTTGLGPLKGWSKYKARLDKKMLVLLRQWAEQRGDDPEQVTLKPWQHRDLRRTARTLMSRLEISSEVAEHGMAHVQSRIKRTYDRYDYLPQKRDAFEKLAAHVERLVTSPPNGSASNVTPLRNRRRVGTRRVA